MLMRRGFTILEVMITIVIMFILVSFLLPTLHKSRARARYVAWKASGHNFTVDQDVVAYYNFEDQVETENKLDRVLNRSAGHALEAARDSSEPVDLDAYIVSAPNDPAWSIRSGRWRSKGAMLFDGNDYLRVKAPKYDFDAGTVFMWVRATPGDVTGLFSTGTTGGTEDEYVALRKLNNNWEAAVRDGNTGTVTAGETALGERKADTSSMPSNIFKDIGYWHHLAVTWHGGKEMRFYFDGVMVQETSLATGEKQINSHLNVGEYAKNWTIGAEGDFAPLAIPVVGLSGVIDEVGVLRTPLDGGLIKAFYRSGQWQ